MYIGNGQHKYIILYKCERINVLCIDVNVIRFEIKINYIYITTLIPIIVGTYNNH